MKQLNSYYLIITILIVIFGSSIYLIKYDEDEEKKMEYSDFILPSTALVSFFISCYFVSRVLIVGSKIKSLQYFGIYFILIIAGILIIYNNSIITQENVTKHIRGKKFSIVGMIMVLGISALIFGFIDNFGLRLGVEALDNSFLNMFLGPLSVDSRFKKEQKTISKNLQYMNNWAGGKWRSVLNQTLRFRDEISKIKNPKIKDLVDDMDELMNIQGGKPLLIPDSIKKNNLTKDFIQNVKRKFDIIEGSKAMMGNAFSNIIGSLLSSALVNLFTYMTKYDSIYTGDDDIDENVLVKKINSYVPFLEAFFITIGCAIPIVLNIAMTQDSYNNNNTKAWTILAIIGIMVVTMMFLSVRGSKKMTEQNKKNSIRKTLLDMKLRLDIDEKSTELNNQVDRFINTL
jgi:hypothetical protein